MKLSILIAASERGVIGKDGTLPWRIPADLRRFKALTMGHALIMGRRTYDSIGRPLPGRKTIVVTSRPMQLPQEIPCASTLLGAVRIAEGLGCAEAFFAGGAGVYREALGLADRIYLTRVHGEVEGDTSSPEFDGRVPFGFVEVGEPEPVSAEGSTHAATFHVYERAK